MDNASQRNEARWAAHYREKGSPKRRDPEGFLVRLLTSSFPRPVVRDRNFAQQKLLDLSCGYGRNLELLIELGFDVHGSEISEEIVESLRREFPAVDFRVGKAHSLPFGDGFLDAVVACNSCYYLEDDTSMQDNLAEICRVLRPGGWFIGSVIKSAHSALTGGEEMEDGSVIVRQDRQNLRNGYRVHPARSAQHLQELLEDRFCNVEIGDFEDTLLGFRRALFYFYAEKRP